MPDLKKMLTLEALSEALPSWLKRSTKPEYNADEIDSTLTTNQFVTASDKDNWNAKGTYSKPSGGIPKSDLSSIVQTSLEKADSALQSETDPTVPTWAKQTNKPSYTQDEVADGSTYKRVTQTEKDTWSGKQNALTTTQMQAVNSGITSEGVAQISTNQNDILTLEKRNGVINLLNFNNANKSNARSVSYEITGDGSIIVNGTPTAGGPSYIVLYLGNDEVHADDYCDSDHVLYGCPSGGSESTYCMYVAKGSYVNYDTGSGTILWSTTQTSILVVIRISDGYTANNLVFKPAIIDKALWDSGFTTPIVKTLPNFTLTPALVEQVDGGAKNKCNWAAATENYHQSCSWTKTDTNLTVTSTGSWGHVRYAIGTLPKGDYVLSVKISSYSAESATCKLGIGSDAGSLVTISGNGTVSMNFTLASDSAVNLYFYANWNSGSYANTYVASEIMVSTKAAYTVSQKFVPYRPSLDIVQSSITELQSLKTLGGPFAAGASISFKTKIAQVILKRNDANADNTAVYIVSNLTDGLSIKAVLSSENVPVTFTRDANDATKVIVTNNGNAYYYYLITNYPG